MRRGGVLPLWIRMVLWGTWKSGKSVLAASFPAPIFIHPVVESGYDSLRIQWDSQAGQWTIPFDVVQLGQIGSRMSVEEELRSWLLFLRQHISADVFAGRRPQYQTIVIGGFSIIQKAVLQGIEQQLPGEKNVMRRFGKLASWAQELTQILFSIPAHVIIEVSASEYRPEGQKVGERAVYYEPEIVGQTKSVVLHDANLILFQEAVAGPRYLTRFQRTLEAKHVDVRLHQLRGIGTVENVCYDLFAERLGLPPIWVADPAHPRCVLGQWPWHCHWHV